jgi:putative hydrolase of the HAD superfamily
VDGTLVDYSTAARPAFEAAAATASALLGQHVSGLDVYYARRSVDEDAEWMTRAVHHIRHESIRRLLDGYGAAEEPRIRSILDAYEDARDRHLTVYPDVVAGLEALAAAGLTVIAASNGNVDLSKVGLADHVHGTHYAEVIGVSKPDPQFFATALANWHIEAHHALVVGDRLDNDYEPARAHGLHAVLLDREGQHASNAEVVRVSALTELAAMIEPA